MTGRQGIYHQNGGGGDPPAEPPAALVIDCQILTPANGDTKTGEWNGVTIVVKGTATITQGTGAIDRVEVDIGGTGFKAATTTTGWRTWEASQLLTSAGVVSITARAIVNGQPYSPETSITITTALKEKPAGTPQPPTDTTPPTVAILTPQPGRAFVLSTTNQVEVAIAGTAADNVSLKAVEVTVDGVPAAVEPKTGPWTNWTARAPLVGAGKHAISAKAVDGNGLSTVATVEVVAVTEPVEAPVVERLMLVERVRLSTFLGRYGLGRVVKTLSLLPGEKTTIAVKSYRRSSETATDASSILDSTTTESQNEFESQLTREQSNKQTTEESVSWNVQGQASAGWGWGSASLSAGATGGSNAAREELAKNVANTVQKHAAKASAKRDVEIKSSREMKKEEGEEFSTESVIENINVSRTLNFVFNQMNQEFISILHLVDVRIAYVRGDRIEDATGERVEYTYREATLSQLDGLLRQVIVPERREEIRREIVNVLSNVFDFEDQQHALVEEKALVGKDGKPIPNASYLRFPKGKTSKYKDPATGTEIVVPGVILSAMKNVMRTDGIFCDSLLGDGIALDGYSQGLQTEAVETRRVANLRERAALAKDQLAMQLVREKNADAAKVFKEVYPAPEAESLALVTTNTGPNGSGG